MSHSIIRALLKEYFARSTAYYYALHEDDKIKSGSSSDMLHQLGLDLDSKADEIVKEFNKFSNADKMYKAFNVFMLKRNTLNCSYISSSVWKKSEEWIAKDKKKLAAIDEQINIMIGVLK